MATTDNLAYTIRRVVSMGGLTTDATQSGTVGKGQPLSVTYDSAGAKTLPLSFDYTKVQIVSVTCDQPITSISFTGTTGPVLTPAIPGNGAWTWDISQSSEPFGANCTAIVVTLTAFGSGVTAATIKVTIGESV